MKLSHLFLAATLVTLTACESKPNPDRQDGVKDALDARPNEELRDAGEEAGDAVKDAAHDIKDGVKAAGEDIKDAVK
jgi:hypothetical protein